MNQARAVCLSGSIQPSSRIERLVRRLGSGLAERGMQVTVFAGCQLELPFYRPGVVDAAAARILDALRASDAVVLGSPAYHGTISGLLKNVLDYANELECCDRPFLDGRPIGCVAIGAGSQGASSTLASLRAASHALRAWPTPLGIAWSGAGDPLADERALQQVCTMAAQIELLATASRRPLPDGGVPAGTSRAGRLRFEVRQRS